MRNEQFKIETILKHVVPNLSDRIVLQRAAAYDAVVKRAGETIEVALATGPIQTEYTINLSGLSNLNFLQYRARYKEADVANNIAQFDPAEVEVNINGLGWHPAHRAAILEGYPLSSLKVRVPLTETIDRVILFETFIGGDGA